MKLERIKKNDLSAQTRALCKTVKTVNKSLKKVVYRWWTRGIGMNNDRCFEIRENVFLHILSPQGSSLREQIPGIGLHFTTYIYITILRQIWSQFGLCIKFSYWFFLSPHNEQHLHISYHSQNDIYIYIYWYLFIYKFRFERVIVR